MIPIYPIFTTILSLFALYSIYKIVKRYFIKPNFTNKTVWITGSSSGIGQFLAYQFSKYNANIIISARNVKQLQRVKLKCLHPQKVKVVQMDMTNFQQIEQKTKQIIKELQSKGDKLDIVVQNAGVSMRCLFKEYHFNNHLALQNVNVHGPYRHMQCFLEHMIKNKNGHIVGVTSVAGKLASSYRSSYSGSKAAFIGILDSLRSELAISNIKVTNLMPGYVNTNLSKNALVAGQSQKFGLTDNNIKTGLSATSFANSSIRAIYNKQNQLQISGMIFIPLAIWLRNLCPDLLFFVMRMNAKNQMKAIQSAK